MRPTEPNLRGSQDTMMVEIMADNASSKAGEVYGGLHPPFAVLVGQMAESYSKDLIPPSRSPDGDRTACATTGRAAFELPG